MKIEIRKKNSKTGKVKVWVFYTLWDYNDFDCKTAKNKIVFSRYHVMDGSKPLKTYDVTSKQIINCTWKEAKPPQEVLDRAWQKFSDTWNFEVKQIRE